MLTTRFIKSFFVSEQTAYPVSSAINNITALVLPLRELGRVSFASCPQLPVVKYYLYSQNYTKKLYLRPATNNFYIIPSSAVLHSWTSSYNTGYYNEFFPRESLFLKKSWKKSYDFIFFKNFFYQSIFGISCFTTVRTEQTVQFIWFQPISGIISID